MINSIILMFSQYNKNKKISNIFKAVWILYAIAASLFNFNQIFIFVNVSAFLSVTGVVYVISKFYSKVNVFLSIISVLIYSLFVDVVCYFVLPNWTQEQSLIQYIINGFLFNCRYVFLNVVVFGIVILYLKTYKIWPKLQQKLIRKFFIKKLEVNY